MDAEEKKGGSYRVEVSGWDSGENFFVEKTLLSWQENGSKKVLLRTPLSEGTLVFVRLTNDSQGGPGIPVTYQVERVGRSASEQGREVQLERLHPKVAEAKVTRALEEQRTPKLQRVS